MNKPPATTLEGQLERITYCNAQTQYTIARLKTAKSPAPVTIVGYLAGVATGETLQVKGIWETHPRYGPQFKIQSYAVTLPAAVDGIQRYLESGLIKGIGPAMAARLVQAFGARTLEVIEKSPQRLLEVEGIGPARADLIHTAWQEHHALRGLMRFLQQMGLKTSWCGKIFRQYGPDAVAVIRDNPYRLAEDFSGSGFYMADTIARHLGLAEDAPARIQACVLHLVTQLADEGHSFAEEQNLLVRCENLFGINPSAGRRAVDALTTAGILVADPLEADPPTRAIYLAQLHAAEAALADRLRAMLSLPPDPPALDATRISDQIVQKLAIRLSAGQLAVVENVFSQRVAIITGGPGTGKTTLLRAIVTLFEALGRRVRLAAPTGRAARRLSEVTDRRAVTIHRLLGYSFGEGRFARDRDNPLEAGAVIIDEASMVDTILMNDLLQAVPVSAVLVLVGDVFQLPAVGPGNVLADLIASGRIPVFYLNEIFRQEQQSSIVLNAHRVRRGQPPLFDPRAQIIERADFYFLEQNVPQKIVERIVRLSREEIPQAYGLDAVRDIQVLTPMHKGLCGTLNLNPVLQKALNPGSARLTGSAYAFKTGDKVMHLKNNYQKEVFNGDIGIITAVDRSKTQLYVDYEGRSVAYDFDELDELTMAYAISVHKSQGSEYPAVIVPLITQHYVLLQRNLLYTAMTRGQQLVILIGSTRALNIALHNDRPQRRLSRLADRLRQDL